MGAVEADGGEGGYVVFSAGLGGGGAVDAEDLVLIVVGLLFAE
jgi:hypothetical protein